IDPALQPDVFLVGIQLQARDKEHPICVSPDDCLYHPELFKTVKSRATQLREVHHAKDLHYSDARISEQRQHQLDLECLRDAVLEVITKNSQSLDKQSFCGWPIA